MYQKLVMLLSIVGLLLTACGGGNEPAKIEGAASERQIVPTHTPDPNATPEVVTVERVAAPNPYNLTGTLVYTADENLYRWDFQWQAEPDLVMENVYTENLVWDNTRENLYFGVWDGSNFAIHQYNIASRSTQLIAQLGRSRDRSIYWSMWQYSPDGQWGVLYSSFFNSGSAVIALDGSGKMVSLGSGFSQTYWTVDNRLVVATYDNSARRNFNEPAPIERVELVNPATEAVIDLTEAIDLVALSATEFDYSARLMLLQTALDNYNTQLVDGILPPDEPTDEYDDIVYIQTPDELINTDFNAPADYCHDWRISRWSYDAATDSYQEGETLYSNPNAANMHDLQRFEDGGVIFVEIVYPDCEYGEPVGQLVYLLPDGTVNILADKLASIQDTNAFRGFVDGMRYVISPDHTHVFFKEYINNGQENNFYLMDIEAGVPITFPNTTAPLKNIGWVTWLPEQE